MAQGEKRTVPPWRELLYEFTQDSTLHGIRFITLSTWYNLRRVLWALAVMTAVGLFVYINVMNVLTFRKYPISVSVEVNQHDKLPFPAVTICNYNLHRLTGLAEQGLYENVLEHYHHAPSDGGGTCKDTFTYYEGYCLDPTEARSRFSSWDGGDISVISMEYVDISELACEELCVERHSLECSSIVYSRSSKTCTVTSVVETRAPDPSIRCPEESLEYYRRNRCPVYADIRCNYETQTPCDLAPSLSDVDPLEEQWVKISAPEGESDQYDHTMGTARGSYMAMAPTSFRPGYTGSMETGYLYFKGSCVEAYYRFYGRANSKLTFSVRNESRVEVHNETRTAEGQGSWKRIYFHIPDGTHQIIVRGQRSDADGETTGMYLDDFAVGPCEAFVQNCKRTVEGVEYQGTRAVSWYGASCLRWSEIASDVIHSLIGVPEDSQEANASASSAPSSSTPATFQDSDFPDATVAAANNYCRNPVDNNFPFCFTTPTTTSYCDIEFCACLPGEFRCTPGQCIPDVYLCDGHDDCGDRSDETTSQCTDRLFECEFETNYLCGYEAEGSRVIWSRSTGVDTTDQYAPTTDYENSVLGGFMYIDGRSGYLGDRSWLRTITHTFTANQCLAFYLFVAYKSVVPVHAFRVFLRSAAHMETSSHLLYETNEETSDWQHREIRMPQGEFQVEFEFTLGYPFQSGAALDSVGVVDDCSDYPNPITGNPWADLSPVSNIDCDFREGGACNYIQTSSTQLAAWQATPAEFVEIAEDASMSCGRHYYSTSGEFSSPFYPGKYPSSLKQCLAHIKAPAAQTITIRFLAFQVEYSESNCEYDAVEIRTGSLTNAPVRVLCGLTLGVTEYNLTDQNVFVSMRSDRINTFSGFLATYSITVAAQIDYTYSLFYSGDSSDQVYWTRLYSPPVQVMTASCFSLSATFVNDTTFQIASVWSSYEILYDTGLIRAPLGHNKVRLNLPGGTHQIEINIEFSGQSGGHQGYVDNISLRPGLCQVLDTSGTLACDFQDTEQCGYLDLSTEPEHWLRSQYSGGYLVVSTINTMERSEFSMATPPVTHASTKCMTISYQAEHVTLGSELVISLLSPANASVPSQYLGHFSCSENGQATQGHVTLPVGTYRVLVTFQGSRHDDSAQVMITEVTATDGACTAQNGVAEVTLSDTGSYNVYVNVGAVYDSGVSTTPAPSFTPTVVTLQGIPPSSRKFISEFRDVRDFYIATSHLEEDFIFGCTYEGLECDPQYTVQSVVDFGVCYTFNHGQSPTDTLAMVSPGTQHGLNLVLNIEQYEHTYGPYYDAGIKVHLHDQSDVSNVLDVGMAAALSSHTLFRLKRIETVSLEAPHGNCSRNRLSYFPSDVEGTRARCNQECATKQVIDQCGCKSFYMPGNASYCNVYDELSCVQNRNITTCPCRENCNMISYEVEQSVSMLSELGVANILESNLERLYARYNSTVELRNRMRPEDFLDTMTALGNIRVHIEEYIAYAEGLTSKWETSEYSLIDKSLEQLLNKVVLNDFNYMLRNVSRFQGDYRKAFTWKHNAQHQIIQDAANHVVSFLGKLDRASDTFDPPPAAMEAALLSNLQNTTRDLKLIVEDAFRYADLNINNPLPTGDGLYLPWTIYPTRNSEFYCAEHLVVNSTLIEAFVRNANQLHAATTLSTFITIAGTFDYYNFADVIFKYLDDFEQCIQYYVKYMDDLEAFDSYFSGNMSINSGFNIEVEAKPLREYLDWFKETLETKYRMAEITKSVLVDRFSDEATTNFLQALTYFREEMFIQIDKPAEDIIIGLRDSMERGYDQLLIHLVNCQPFFNEGDISFETDARTLHMWRQPYTDLYGDVLVQLGLPVDRLWQVWPSNMDLATFSAGQVKVILYNALTNIFEPLENVLEGISKKFTSMAATIQADMEALKVLLQEYKQKTIVDEKFILENFLMLEVYYGELTSQKIQQHKAYELSDFFSDFGGYMGLLLGASVMTVCELLDLIVYNCARKIHTRNKNVKVVTPAKTDETVDQI